MVVVASADLTADTALAFLAEHQHVPQDAPQEVISQIDEVRKYFMAHPDARCIPLFLDVFEDHMGRGVFQLCDDVFAKYSEQQLAPHIKRALGSPRKGVRWWAAHWAMVFPSAELVPELKALLLSAVDDDAHYFAISALGDLLRRGANESVGAFLRSRLAAEIDPEKRELLQEYVGGQ